MKKMKDTRYMVTLAMMAAIVVLLANTPLGMIQLPVIKATTVHIPVIIGSILLGPGAGAILGGVFGLCSMVSNTQAPTLLSFAFSPFLSTTGLIGALKALWVSIGCRVMIGVVSGSGGHRLCRFYDKYHFCHGQHLPPVRAAVRGSQECRYGGCIRPCDGYGGHFRCSGSCRGRNPGHGNHGGRPEIRRPASERGHRRLTH